MRDGERTTYAYDPANQLEYADAASGRTTYLFDAAGNQEIETASSGRTTHSWDYENKLVLTKLPTGGRVTAAYNPDGLRVRKEE